MNDLLSQEEIDALLHGVGSGDIETEADDGGGDGEAQNYDFTSQDRIVRGRMPTLEMINERFARYFRISLFNMLRRQGEISVGGVQMLKFGEYIHSLFVPTSLNLVKINPLRGTALFVFDPKLVFSAVDNYFGGDGRFHTKIEGREFTPTEQRVIQRMLDRAFEDLFQAWRPVLPVEFEYLNHEVNPQFANIVSPTEVVVVSTFHIELEGGGGALHITLPYSMVEPIRDLLDAGVQSDRSDVDERWRIAIKEEMKDAEVELSSQLAETTITFRELMEMQPGDVIPIDMPETILLRSEEIPLFRGRLGSTNGNKAVKILDKVNQTAMVPLNNVIDKS
ncbi:flagellar motor switch protein FliM [Thiohalobacter thiocyanaticus]|uniref:Flagellar motor switch protein FliM n=1 Tax=Thiohalobacter thiocyanaticus TaxID=585455 RepID=A0A426QGN3_9GAMM|nr:flagellar motor switch protein FliM [Thiohalobacter thiocyanaticus]RRQ20906.1 flagellar motor switch protein FliM [Thiohalobacter thiocyanaticus]